MEQPDGIITVVDQSHEQEDEDLVALRELPKFEPLMVNEQPSHFSLASVFGSLSTSTGLRHESSEMAFNPSVLVDMLVQMNAHNKKCAQDIQEYQRVLGLKIKVLDEYTTGAVRELTTIHQRAKNHSDHLLSGQEQPFHALTKQAHTTRTLLHGIVDKIVAVSEILPADIGMERPSAEKYPNLYHYLQQAPSAHPRPDQSPADEGSSSGSGSTPSGLALLGHSAVSRPHRPAAQQHPPRTAALSVPKARASMALASSSLNILSVHDPTLDQGHGDPTSQPFEGSSPLGQVPRSITSSSLQDQLHGNIQAQPQTKQPQQQTTLRASDNLRRLASKAPPSSTMQSHSHDHLF
ncbi:hypothetical protein EDD21DRAFT_7815 [Dissophora ornata]|nr:hypothetical protein EDD21DRAFT_7815 [Dissophora ornata]